MIRPFIIFLGLALLSACASPHDKKDGLGPAHPIYSPTGDPLNGGPLGRPTCEEALKKWFERVDANHDGTVTLDEFLNDAKAQFQRMDIDKNGYLVSEEVERFRMPYRDFHSGGKKEHDKGREGSGGNENSAASVIDPVMSADTNLDYKVTPDEYTAYSRNTFKALDAGHNGTLTLGEAAAVCGPKP